MKIDSQTRISAILKHNSAAIEAIASINPHFNKLRNPILRRVLAPRVTVEDAARIGGCSVQDILEKLQGIGFEADVQPAQKSAPEAPAYGADDEVLAAVRAGRVQVLDVRPILEGGADPFQTIMGALKTLPGGQALEVVNSFEPTPLIKILRKKGYGSFTRAEGGAVHTFFLKVAEAQEDKPDGNWLFRVSMDALNAQKSTYAHCCRELDVRDLEMPLPMVAILNELGDLPEGGALFVHHKKTPQYLLPELEERGFKAWIAELGEGDVKLLIHR